jgi:RNA polymerase sigma-70 factor (ECF subfamily)
MDSAASPALALMPKPAAVDAEIGLETLVERARTGNVRAFEALYRRCEGRVYALCMRLCADRSEAESMTQDAFVLAWQKLESYRAEAAFTSWLHRLTVNLVLQRRRSDQRRRNRERARASLRAVSESPQAQRDTGLDLEAAIAALPERARTVLVLHDLEGYRHREIATLLQVSEGTSKAQLHRARTQLREVLR